MRRSCRIRLGLEVFQECHLANMRRMGLSIVSSSSSMFWYSMKSSHIEWIEPEYSDPFLWMLNIGIL